MPPSNEIVSSFFRSSIAITLCCFCASASAQQKKFVSATIQIDAGRVENHISPRLYAAFTEMMAEGVNRGMTAEMLLDRSFEGAPDYLGLPAGWRAEPDLRDDNVGAIRYAAVADQAYPIKNAVTGAPEHSLRVVLAPGDITDARRGLSQGRLSLVARKQYRGYIWVKSGAGNDSYKGEMTVALEEDNMDGKEYASAALTGFTGDWVRYSFTLTPTVTDRFAKFSLLFHGRGTLYLDEASLELADAQGEVRSDTEAAVKLLRPSFLRWPGGNVAQDYHWQWGVGPRDARPVWVNKSWSNAPEPDDFGTDEYLAFCKRTGIEPSITVNVDGAGATPEEAAAWVEYVNGPASSKYGAMRAANGHPEPYGVKQWELGNEIFGGWVRGHVTAEQYAMAAVKYARAMRAVDPGLQLIAVGEGTFPGSDEWNGTVARITGPDIQFLAIHDYTSVAQNAKEKDPRAAMMARAKEFTEHYQHTGEVVRQAYSGHPIKFIVNEWNLFYDAQTIQSMDGAVYAARMMNGFERQGDLVEAHCISDLLNGWVGGVIQATRDRVIGTSQYEVLKMYRDVLGTVRVAETTVGPELQQGVPALDAVATRSADGSTIYVTVSNAGLHQDVRTSISVQNFAITRDAQVMMLAEAEPSKINRFDQAPALLARGSTLRCRNTCTVTLMPDSVLTIVLHRR